MKNSQPADTDHFRWDGDKLTLHCSIQANSSEDRIVGLVAGLIKIRLTAAPVDGKANKHLIKYLSKQFDVKRSAITILRGHGSRQKSLCIENPESIPNELGIGSRS
ncbi:MAG: YggU family protein [Proteobacteria bacterium]|nr:YggU family protein [Pseudomonadota bacterium]